MTKRAISSRHHCWWSPAILRVWLCGVPPWSVPVR